MAKSADEVVVAQRLRFHVFHEQQSSRANMQGGLDSDQFDAVAEHLLVIEPDTSKPSPFAVQDGNVVGTYRLITQAKATQLGQFYSEREFEIRPLLQRHPNLKFLELGRSCVLREHRGTAVIEMLWQGIWDFVRAHRIDVMFGCASFDGIDPNAHAAALSFLAQYRAAPESWHVRAQPDRMLGMNMLPTGSYDTKQALRDMPPLVRGYLRLGCYFGEGAVIDRDFNSIDVLVILPVSAIDPRYFARFGAPA